MPSSSGFLYAVCNGDDVHHTKLGFTTSKCPAAYLISNYARTMPKVRTRKLMSVPDTRLGENMLFAALAEYRIDPRHEVFDLHDANMEAGFEAVHDAFVALGGSNGRMTPSYVVPMTVEEYLLHRHNVMERRKADRAVATKRKLEKRLNEKRAAKQARNAERQTQIDDERVLKKEAKREELVAKVQQFINDRCERRPGAYAPA